MEEEFSLIIEAEDLNRYQRFDLFLVDKIASKSRTFIKKIFEMGLITLDDDAIFKGPLTLKKMPPINTTIKVEIPPPIPVNAQPENIPLDIIFEDEHLIILNKAAGMVVHPAPGHYSGTLVNALVYYFKDVLQVGEDHRPGLVHRLDKGTSGVMVVAKTPECHEKLVLLFSQHDIKREYYALVCGQPPLSAGTVVNTIGRHPQQRQKMKSNTKNGKRAVTHYQVVERSPYLTLLKCTLETGKTHQIRVHTSENLDCPIFNDYTYAQPKNQLSKMGVAYQNLINDYEHPFLHAHLLGFIHPMTQQPVEFTHDPPDIFKKVVGQMRMDQSQKTVSR